MSYLYKAFGWVLDLCYKIVPNYLVAILLFALIIKIVMFPLGIKQQKNSQKRRVSARRSLLSARSMRDATTRQRSRRHSRR